MKKIPTLFERDPENKQLVINKITPGCEWISEIPAVARRKYDGACCAIIDGKLYKRRVIKGRERVPGNFRIVDVIPNFEKGDTLCGWIPITDDPTDQYFREGYQNGCAEESLQKELADGTYELLGPKVQGNPEGYSMHVLFPHAYTEVLINAPRDYDALKHYLERRDIEGIVFAHNDGRMAKIKKRDFGLKREVNS